MRQTPYRMPARVRAAAIVALLWVGALAGPLGPATGAARPLALDFSGSGNITDQGAFGVFAGAVEVTLWSSSGIAAGPLLLSAGAGGSYNWSFGQVPPGSLANLTLVAWLPWDLAVNRTTVFDVSNGTPRTLYPGEDLALPFAALEAVNLVAPSADLVVARGRQVDAPVVFANVGNVSVGHTGFALATASPNLTVSALDAGPAPTEERPGASFGFNASFAAAALAGIENLTVTFSVVSLSGANLSFQVTVRIVPSRNARVSAVSTLPSPPDEGRPTQIRIDVGNTGSDVATATDVRVRLFNATVADLYSNASRLDLPGNSTTPVMFGWLPAWSPDPVTIDASVSTALDFDASDDARSLTFAINATNLPPAVAFSSPANGSRLSGNVTVAGAASDPEGGALALAFSIDGAPPFLTSPGPSFGFVWDLAPMADGPHALSAAATDDRGHQTVAVVNVIALNRGPNTPPTVTLAYPRDGDTVGANVSLGGSADDERSELAAVMISVDGGPEFAADGTSPWNSTWAPSAGGPHTLRVRSFDGIEFSAPLFANVSANLTPPSSILFSSVQVTPAPAVPGEDISVAGLVAFDTAVLSSGALVSAQIQGSSATVTAPADNRGAFTLHLTAPNAVGSYLILLAATSGGAAGNASAPLSVSTSSLPDLSLLASSFAVDPDPPPPNTPIHHTITVVNSGSVAATATLRVWDGARSASTLIFESRFTVTTSRPAGFDHAYLPGVHNLTIAVEEVTPQDGNLADNALVVSVLVLDAPDFVVESISPSTNVLTAGSPISLLVVVFNSATTLGSVRLEMWDGEPLAQGSSLFDEEEHLTIAGGARERVIATWTPEAGTHTIFAKAVLAVPDELVLTNNELNITLVVPGAPPAPTPGFLPGFGGLGALGAAAAGAFALRAKRAQRPRRPRKAVPAALSILLILGLAAAVVPPPAGSSFSDASDVPGPLNGVCQTCHSDPNGGAALNAFGVDFQAERNGSGGEVNWTRLGALDSDHDTYSNGAELSDAFLPGDPNSNPSTGVRYSYGGTSLLTGLLMVLVVTGVGVWLGVSMLNKRNARRAAKEAQADAGKPPAPKP